MGNQLVTLVRHAKSSWQVRNQSDHDRPLNDRGVRDAPDMAERLVNLHCIPNLILCSSARRTQETAEFLTHAFQLSKDQIQVDSDLYLASPDTILQALRCTPEGVNHVMVIAHNPGLENLSARMSPHCATPMATMAVRHFSCTSIRDLHSNLPTEESDAGIICNPLKIELIFDDFPKNR